MSERSLETQMREVLANMEVWLQFGTTVSLEPATSQGERSYGRPPGDAWPPHVVWRERWMRASVLEHERLLREATEELEGLLSRKRTVVVEETQGELEARMVVEGRGWDVRQVSLHFNCTPTLVRRVRLSAGVDQATGDPLVELAAVLPRGERAETVRRMRGEGKTMRQIAMFLKCDPMTVHRDLAA